MIIVILIIILRHKTKVYIPAIKSNSPKIYQVNYKLILNHGKTINNKKNSCI